MYKGSKQEITYNDQQITKFISEHKKLPDNWRSELDSNRELYIIGEDGNQFRLIARLNKRYPTDFSVILGIINPNTGNLFRLRRYNGLAKRMHKNKLEKTRVYSYHIHYATQRYQERGYDEDGYAEETDRYSDIEGALQCLFNDANFELPQQSQFELFRR